MIVWLEKSLALAIHDRQLAEFGGSVGVRDETLLESVLARPQQLFAYGDPPPDLADLAASLAFGLARNHPFVDGNKRTAHVSYRTFLLLNGADLAATDEDKYLTMLTLAEGKLSEKDFAAFLRSHIQVKAQGKLNEKKATYKTRSPTRKPAAKHKRSVR
ncbi:MAG TPA: type II toxin-antitoxin system death-on-curing family toxin [Candidatus Acidoferrales bacterium]|nr:type II toxin-antitoxin system death-on-curing family toxin [Candidatus Acidoferrales bacterium]